MHKEWMLKGKALGMGQGLGIEATRNQINVPLNNIWLQKVLLANQIFTDWKFLLLQRRVLIREQ